jgi:alpha-L-fucosidase
LRVGFYYSPADWHYPGYPIGDVDFDYGKRGTRVIADPVAHRALADRWYAYTISQIEELLTRYGQIDVMWFDGGVFPGIPNFHTMDVINRVRELQPGIVINNRWGRTGDWGTPECHFPETRPSGWWELCHIWQGGHGGWGYSHEPKYRPLTWVMEMLVRSRAWGGNFLCNVGPAGDGTMHPKFYEGCAALAKWMAHSRESVIGALPVPDPERANVPLTRREGEELFWYLHLLPAHEGEAVVYRVPRPGSVRLLRTGEDVEYRHQDDRLCVVPPAERTGLDDVVVVTWSREPEP